MITVTCDYCGKEITTLYHQLTDETHMGEPERNLCVDYKLYGPIHLHPKCMDQVVEFIEKGDDAA